MNFFQKYRVVIILLLAEIVFYFRINTMDRQTYFFTWVIIGFAFLIFNVFNVIKANPIIRLFTIKKQPQKKISENNPSPKGLWQEENLASLLFILMNFLLYLIV